MSLNVQSGLGQAPTFVNVTTASLAISGINVFVNTNESTDVSVVSALSVPLSNLATTAQGAVVVTVPNLLGVPVSALSAQGSSDVDVFATLRNVPVTGVATHSVVAQPASTSLFATNRLVDWTYAGATIVDRQTKSGSTIAAYSGNANTINNAINAASTNTYVELGAGTFTISTAILPKSNVTLRGQGMSTIINFTNDTNSPWPWEGGGCPLPIMGTFSGYGDGTPTTESVPAGQTRTWTGTGGNVGVYARGATEINLSSAGPPVGSYVVLYQANEPNGNLPKAGWFASSKTGTGGTAISWQGTSDDHGQTVTFRAKVVAVNGSAITIDIPLPHGLFDSALSPQVGWSAAADFIANFGLESLRVNTQGMGVHHTGIGFFHAHNCWIKGVGVVPKFTSFHANGASDYVIIALDSFQCTVRDCWIDKAIGGGNSTTTTYSLTCKASTHLLYENNILYNAESAIVPQIGSMGCVFSHNLEVYVGDDGQESGVQPHEAGNLYNLYEGNSIRKFWCDLFHGNATFGTVFRNHLYGWGFSLDSYHRYWNFSGNTIRATAVRKSLVTDSTKYDRFGPEYAYRLGYPSESASSANTQGVAADPLVGATTMIWGDYDTFTNSVTFSAGDVPSAEAFYPNSVPSSQVLPSSMFLTARPSYFDVGNLGSVPFPAIGSNDVTGGFYMGGRANKIPAELMYDDAGTIANFDPSKYGTTGGQITATSASRTAVLAAIAQASPGDTVIVPAGTVSWAGDISISGITLKGPGKDAGSPLNVTAGKVNITKHASQMTTLRGIRFTGSSEHIDIGGSSSNAFFRVHDCYLFGNNAHILQIGANGGLFSECEFFNTNLTSGGNHVHLTLGAGAAANATWAAAHTMGDADIGGTANVYFEDCTISNYRDGFPDVDNGGKCVIRNCVINDASIITHGGGSGGSGNDSSQYGARHLEVYSNTFNRVDQTANGPFNQWVYYRGATGVVANNVWDDPSTAQYGGKPCVRLGVGNCSAGYPRQYQVGQGTQAADSTPNTPLQFFGNTGFAITIGKEANPNTSCSNPSAMIVLDRDYTLTQTWWNPYTYPHPLRPT